MVLKTIINGVNNLLIRRYLGPFWYRRYWLNNTEWSTKAELEQLQLGLLKRLVCYSECHVPYYQKIMKKQGFTTADIHSLEDIKLFPILTKRDVIEAGGEIISKAYPRMLLRHAFTGGTTGTPLNLYRSLFSIGTEHAFVRRQWDWAGLCFKDICAFVKGRVIDNEQKYIYDPIMKELHFSTYHLNMESAKQYLHVMKKYGCKGLVGYPSSVFIMAKAKMDMDIQLQLKSILLTSETLSADIKNYITKAFDVEVYDFYGAAERVCYIFSCEKGSYHIQPEYGFTEFLPTYEGGHKIISTGFWNYAMPLIRYDTGDRVICSEDRCSCGRNFQTIKQICGREGDYVKTPGGKMLGVSILTHTFHVICGIDCFEESQIIQDHPNHLRILYVPSINFDCGRIVEYSRRLKEYIGQEMEIDFEPVHYIPKTNSGKHKFVVSQL